MKQRLFLAVALSLIALTSNAQKDKSYGVRAGYTSSHLSVDGDKIGSTDNNYFVSLYKDTKVFPFLHFQSALEYSRMGGTYQNHSHHADYLGVPLSLKVKFGPLYAFGGGAFNVKLSENDFFPNTDYSSSSKWYDTNAFVGAGLEIIIFTLDVKYVKGLTNINNGLKNDGYQIGLGLRF